MKAIGRALSFASSCAVVSALAACSREADSSAFTVVDSAGVRIVTNTAPAWGEGEGLVVSEVPELVIGGIDAPEEQELYQVRGALRLPGGDLVVLNGGSSELLFFGPDGTVVATAGGAGQGPGELAEPLWLSLDAGEIVVFDPFQANGRISYFALDGAYERSTPTPQANLLGIRSVAFSGGSLVGTVADAASRMAHEGRVATSAYVVRLRPGAEGHLDTLGFAPGPVYMRIQVEGFYGSLAVPFGPSTRLAVGLDRVALGDGTRMAIELYGIEDGTHASIRAPERGRPVTQALYDRYVEERYGPLVERNPSFADALEAVRGADPPATMPEHAELVLDAANRLWVHRYEPTYDPPSPDWLVFSDSGRWLGTVRLPHGLTVHEIGDDYVLGVLRDDLDVESVVLYGLSERTGA